MLPGTFSLHSGTHTSDRAAFSIGAASCMPLQHQATHCPPCLLAYRLRTCSLMRGASTGVLSRTSCSVRVKARQVRVLQKQLWPLNTDQCSLQALQHVYACACAFASHETAAAAGLSPVHAASYLQCKRHIFSCRLCRLVVLAAPTQRCDVGLEPLVNKQLDVCSWYLFPCRATWGELSLKAATGYHVKLHTFKHGHRPVPCFVKRRSLQSEKSTASFNAFGATACRLCCSSAMPANRAVEFGIMQQMR